MCIMETVKLFVEKETILDLSESSNNHQQDEWIIETDANHIFYFSFLNANEHDKKKLLSASISVIKF